MKHLFLPCLCVLLSLPVLAQDLRVTRIIGTTSVTATSTIKSKLIVAGQETNANIIANEKKLSITFDLTMSRAESIQQKIPGLRNKLYMAAQYKDQWYAKNTNKQWVNWDGSLATLPHFAFKNDAETETIWVIDNVQLPAGEYQVHIGYSANMQTGIVYNSQALSFIITENSTEGLQRLNSNTSLEHYLKAAIRKNSDYESYLIDGKPWNTSFVQQTDTNFSFDATNIEPIATTPLSNIIRHKVDQGGLEKKGIAELFFLTENDDNSSNFVSINYSSLLEPTTSPDPTLGFDIDLQNGFRHSKMFHYSPAQQNENPIPQSLIVVSSETTEADYEDKDFFRDYTSTVFIDTQPVSFVRVYEDGFIKDDNFTTGEFYTTVDISDASDPNAIKPSHRFKLDAQRVNSYRVNNILYVITRHLPYINGFIHYVNDQTNQFNQPYDVLLHNTPLQNLLPTITINDRPAQPLLKGENCYIPVSAGVTQEKDVITTITAIPLDNPSAFQSSCLLTGVDAIHGTENAIYLFKQRGSELNTLYKFAYQDTGFMYQGATTLTGFINFKNIQKHYYLDEYKNVLRIFSIGSAGFKSGQASSLSLIKQLDGENKLEQSSFITLPKQLTMDSHLIQFSGPRLVLFEREEVKKDVNGLKFYTEVYRSKPLHILDLSDPGAPEEMGQIQTNGYLFSLFPINDFYLMGIGKDSSAPVIDQQGNNLDYAHYQGLKLSLYDLSDKDNPQEVNAITIGQRGTESALFFDPKAYAFTPETDTQPAKFALPLALAETATTVANIPNRNLSGNNYSDYLATLDADTTPLAETDFYASRYNTALGPPIFDWTETGVHVFDIQTLTGTPQISLSGKLLTTRNESAINYPHRNFINWNDRIILNNTGLYYRHKVAWYSSPNSIDSATENYFLLGDLQ